MNEHEEHSLDSAIYHLKEAAMYRKQRDFLWVSRDGEFAYHASTGHDPEIDAVDLGNLPGWKYDEVYNGWIIRRINVGKVGLQASMQSTLYNVAQDFEVAEWDTPTSLLDGRVDDPIASIEDNQNMIEAIGKMEPPVLQDYANLDNAIFDLHADTRELVEELNVRRLSMTEDEKYLARQMQREWLVEPEESPTGKPLWWSVSTSSALFSVLATNAEEALQRVEDKFYEGEALFIYWVGMEQEEYQAALRKYAEQQTLRMIPFSHVPWPDDRNNLTDEQREAFDAWKRATSN